MLKFRLPLIEAVKSRLFNSVTVFFRTRASMLPGTPYMSHLMEKRDWQNWDVGTVAETIEEIWQSSTAESDHRGRLSALVARNITDQSMTLLEVGCGTGQVYSRLVPAILPNSGYLGVDVSEKMLEIARRNFPNGRFLQGDAYDLDFDDRSFDVVVCFEVLGHLPKIEPVIGELLRVAKQKCIFTVWQCAGPEIVTQDVFVDGARFLYCQHPDAYVRGIIERKATIWAKQTQTVTIREHVVAYVLGSSSTAGERGSISIDR